MNYDLMHKRLVEARELIGYNRKEFAELLNIPYRTMTNYENGSREPGSDYLAKVSKICGVTTDWLLGISDNKNSPGTAEAMLGDEYLAEAMVLWGKLHQNQKKAIVTLLRSMNAEA